MAETYQGPEMHYFAMLKNGSVMANGFYGKETVQGLMLEEHVNGILEPYTEASETASAAAIDQGIPAEEMPTPLKPRHRLPYELAVHGTDNFTEYVNKKSLSDSYSSVEEYASEVYNATDPRFFRDLMIVASTDPVKVTESITEYLQGTNHEPEIE